MCMLSEVNLLDVRLPNLTGPRLPQWLYFFLHFPGLAGTQSLLVAQEQQSLDQKHSNIFNRAASLKRNDAMAAPSLSFNQDCRAKSCPVYQPLRAMQLEDCVHQRLSKPNACRTECQRHATTTNPCLLLQDPHLSRAGWRTGNLAERNSQELRPIVTAGLMRPPETGPAA